MTTQYTPILQLALPVTGELNGTWGDVVNDNITSMVEEAIAGLATISTWTANAHTLTTADGVTDEARCAMLVLQTGAGGTALSGAGQVICPARTKLYVVKNDAAYAVTVKTSGGSGVAIAAGDTAFLFCDGTNVGSCVTQIVNGHITGNLTVEGNATVNGNTTLGNATSDTITANARIASDLNPSADNTYDLGTSGNSWRNLYIDGTATIATLNVTTIDTTNLEVTNIKAKDGTAAITLADSTGVATFSANPILNAGTANQVQFLNGSKQLVGDADLTFDGTTLSATNFTSSGTVTLSGATANGVMYANGSKVLTTGSALTFDGTNLGVGNGTATRLVSIDAGAGAAEGGAFAIKQSGSYKSVFGTRAVVIGSGTDSSLMLQSYSDDIYLSAFGSSKNIIFAINNNTEQMRLTSTGLGIGTSSPTSKLTIGTGSYSAAASGTTGLYTTASGLEMLSDSYFFGNRTGGTMMLLNSSGNLGLGVTPSAWSSGTGAFQSNGAAFYGYGSGAELAQNAYYNGGWKYMANGYASHYVQSNSSHQWHIAPSGTAGNAISFTQAMTLDASGNLGIGTTSPAGALHVYKPTPVAFVQDSSVGVSVGLSANSFVSSAAALNTYNNYPLVFGTNNAERMRITSAGYVGIGTSSPSNLLHVYGGISQFQATTASAPAVYMNFSSTNGTVMGRNECLQIFNNNSTANNYSNIGFYDANSGVVAEINAININHSTHVGALAFATRNAGSYGERMRIDSSGNVGIGTSSPSAKLDVASNIRSTGFASLASGAGAEMFYAGNEGYFIAFDRSGATYQPVNVDGSMVKFHTGASNTERMRIDSAGNVGIGTSNITEVLTLNASSNVTTAIRLKNQETSVGFISNGAAFAGTGSSNDFVVAGLAAGTSTIFGSAGIERMRIDSSGRLLVNTTSTPLSSSVFAVVGNSTFVNTVTIQANNTNTGIAFSNLSGTASYAAAQFCNGGTSYNSQGNITVNASSVTYNTSSDYRLKENIQPMQNALGVVAQLNPVTYRWKADGSDGQGFIAHELQAVVPDCVTGEKDAVDAEGNPVYQGIDTSFLVATLTKAIQEQQEQINQLKAEVAALKAK